MIRLARPSFACAFAALFLIGCGTPEHRPDPPVATKVELVEVAAPEAQLVDGRLLVELEPPTLPPGDLELEVVLRWAKTLERLVEVANCRFEVIRESRDPAKLESELSACASD